MSDTSNTVLQRAYTLIENDEPEKAQEILAPLLQEDANNAHLWWVYTHAVNDASIGQAALERVLELDPQYPGARELKAEVLEAQSKDPDLVAFETDEASAEYTASPIEVDNWEDLQPAGEPQVDRDSSRARLFIAAAVLIIAIAGGAFILSGAIDLDALLADMAPSPAPRVIVVSDSANELTTAEPEVQATAAREATAEAVEPIAGAGGPESAATDHTEAGDPEPAATDRTETGEPEPAATDHTEAGDPEPAATDRTETGATTQPESTSSETDEATAVATEQATARPTISPGSTRVTRFVSMVADEIADFLIDRSTSGTLPTNLGNTLVFIACAVPGPEFNARLEKVLTTIVDLANRLPEEIEAVAAGLLNCDDDEASMRIVGVSRETVEAFANEEIRAKEFQRTWQPLS